MFFNVSVWIDLPSSTSHTSKLVSSYDDAVIAVSDNSRIKAIIPAIKAHIEYRVSQAC